MLPAGFQFTRHIDGPALMLAEHLVASATPANGTTDAPWRICFPYSGPRYHFGASEGGARAYMEAWAAKWEVTIRQAVVACGPESGFAHLGIRDHVTANRVAEQGAAPAMGGRCKH
jgi:hypothetical protein